MILLFCSTVSWLASSAKYHTCFPLLVDSRLSILKDTWSTPNCDSQSVDGFGDSSSGYRVSEIQPTLSWETPALQKQLGKDHIGFMGVGSHTGLQSTFQSAALSDMPTKSFNSPSSKGSCLAAGDWEYRIAGKFGGDLNLAVWRSGLKPPN